ncbi:hypothetical protein CYMTET_23069 [Cymbomonas tetramitiformis]|uniref:Uncharacterized protein n=1 Tax=Cymbomonas tetramitiformis TaxID=36881 RepID=A0AAE0G054_9CHLO|nr:hypothetical protein CYMTET_23069 [Cymbomonas tetramitiformis]
MSAGRTRLQRQPAGTREFPRPAPIGAGGTLLQSVKEGDYEDVKLRISKGEDITQQDDLGLTPLHYAARAGKGICLELLLNNGADPNRRCHLGRTPLHYAARYGFSQVVGSLCRLGKSKTINVDARDKSKWTPLHLAAEKGHPKVAQTLLTNGAKVDAVIEVGQPTSLT